MSMDDTPQEGFEPEVDPGDAGDIVEGGQADEVVEQLPERRYVEVEDPDNRYVRVKVDGVEQEIPYSEALRGYSREADYTRKTQELAQQREQAALGLRIQQAFQRDPRAAIEGLRQYYGINDAPQAPEPEPEFDDPLERQIWEQSQYIKRLESRFEDDVNARQLDNAIAGLQRQFNLNQEDVAQVLEIAYEHNYGTQAFPMIWKQIAYDRVAARAAAMQDSQRQEAERSAQRKGQAAAASQVVSQGTHGGNGLTNEVDVSNKHMTLQEAIELTFEQLGI